MKPTSTMYLICFQKQGPSNTLKYLTKDVLKVGPFYIKICICYLCHASLFLIKIALQGICWNIRVSQLVSFIQDTYSLLIVQITFFMIEMNFHYLNTWVSRLQFCAWVCMCMCACFCAASHIISEVHSSRNWSCYSALDGWSLPFVILPTTLPTKILCIPTECELLTKEKENLIKL